MQRDLERGRAGVASAESAGEANARAAKRMSSAANLGRQVRIQIMFSDDTPLA